MKRSNLVTPRRAANHARRPWVTMFRTLSLSLAILVGTVASVGSIVLWKIQASIASVSLGDVKLSGIAEMEGAFNVLIIGSDTREGLSSGFGDISSALNDVNIVVHVSADHTRATAVSIPRDLIVPTGTSQTSATSA